MGSVAEELCSRYVLFSCEGAAEGVVIERLFESGRLIVPEERVVIDPITYKPFTRLRKAANIEDRFFTQNYAVDGAEGLLLARVVDSRNAQFSLSRVNRDAVPVRTFVTAPEIEMLVIHAEGAYEDWCRVSRLNRHLKPSEYCTDNLGMREVKSGDFLRGYWDDAERLILAIQAYSSKRGKRKANELMLANLLR